MTWHHVEDGKTMQLVPEELHIKVRHTGGAALLREKRNK
ncbi:MAG: HNH endonuclease [Rickettsia endosymbiont of Platyusa sonomae]|nr:HNH endonuclease [Rickettsia endosymbiont of Platyusa sonomae]